MLDTINFGAGPAMLPAPVKDRIKDELHDWANGMSVMEASHRSRDFIELADRTTDKLRNLLNIPNDYEILFLPGGARQQFSMLPLNFLNESDTADYIISGFWSQWAYEDAVKLRRVNIIGNSFDDGYLSTPDVTSVTPNASYIHYTDNETIHGVEYKGLPISCKTPLVADMTSSLMSKPIDVAKHSLIYASCQKNLGISGITIVILDPKFLKEPDGILPNIMRYEPYIRSKSMLNTPPTFPWYVLDLMLDWVVAEGGVEKVYERNIAQSKRLYDFIDSSHLYGNAISLENRSRMNITFHLLETKLESTFAEKAKERGLYQLNGHRMNGGFRASLYNAMTDAGIDRLISFMKEFEKNPFK